MSGAYSVPTVKDLMYWIMQSDQEGCAGRWILAEGRAGWIAMLLMQPTYRQGIFLIESCKVIKRGIKRKNYGV